MQPWQAPLNKAPIKGGNEEHAERTPKSEPEGQKSKLVTNRQRKGKGMIFVSENVGWCRAWHISLFPLRSRHGSAAACRELAVKVVCHKRGREIGERARPTLGSTEAPYYGTFFISERTQPGLLRRLVFFSAISEHSFWLPTWTSEHPSFALSGVCLAAWGGGKVGSAMESAFLHYNRRA
jgi:hypothetical protein